MEYKNYKISFDQETGEFSVPELDLKSELWRDVTAAIRAAINAEKKKLNEVKRIPVIKIGGGWGFKKHFIVPGLAGKAEKVGFSSRMQYWFSSSLDGKRSKEDADKLYLDTPENRTIIDSYFSLCARAEEFNKEAQKMLETTKTLQPPEQP